MIKNITNSLIIFFIFQQFKSQISQILTKMELTRFAIKLFYFTSFWNIAGEPGGSTNGCRDW